MELARKRAKLGIILHSFRQQLLIHVSSYAPSTRHFRSSPAVCLAKSQEIITAPNCSSDDA
jgi:hypothetical protein